MSTSTSAIPAAGPTRSRDISFEALPGQVIGIVGPTGAGKSTLVSLLPRFYDSKQGRILLDGVDTRELTLKALRQNVSIVLQEPLLFSGSIAENIRYGGLTRARRKSLKRRKRRTPMISSWACRTNTRPFSANVGRRSPEGSASADRRGARVSKRRAHTYSG